MRKSVVIFHLNWGLGRITKEDKIDHLAGIVLEKKIGDKVEEGETLAYIHTNREQVIDGAIEELKRAYEISKSEASKYEHILGII